MDIVRGFWRQRAVHGEQQQRRRRYKPDLRWIATQYAKSKQHDGGDYRSNDPVFWVFWVHAISEQPLHGANQVA